MVDCVCGKEVQGEGGAYGRLSRPVLAQFLEEIINVTDTRQQELMRRGPRSHLTIPHSDTVVVLSLEDGCGTATTCVSAVLRMYPRDFELNTCPSQTLPP